MKSESAGLVRFFSGLTLALALIYFLAKIGGVLLPFVLGLALAYVLNPLVRYFEIKGLSRGRVVAGIYLALLAVLAFGAVQSAGYVGQNIAVMKFKLPLYARHAQKSLDNLQRAAAEKLPVPSEALENLKNQAQGAVSGFFQELPARAATTFHVFSLFFLVPFVSFFALLEGPRFIEAVFEFCPSRHVESFLSLICRIDESLGNYIRGILIEAALVFLMALGGLIYLKIDYAVGIAAVAGVTNLVPYIGPFAGTVAGSLVALFQYQSLAMVLKVVVLFAVVQFIDEWILAPFILKKAVELHPLVILFALMCGAQLFGAVGLVFAVPAACVLKVLAQISLEWYLSESGLKRARPSFAVSVPYT